VRTTRDLTMETIGLMLGGAHDMHDLDEEAIHAEA
jgi:simple sugar transport system ATP-binding protein